MIWQSKTLGLSYEKLAQNLNVDKSTVCRTVQLSTLQEMWQRRNTRIKCFSKSYTPKSAIYFTANYGKGRYTYICTRPRNNSGPCFRLMWT